MNLKISLGCVIILTILNFPLHEQGIYFLLSLSLSLSLCVCVCCLQYISAVSYRFLSTGLSPPWLGLFFGILFLQYDSK